MFFPKPKKPFTLEPKVFLGGGGGGVAALKRFLKELTYGFTLKVSFVAPVSSSANILKPGEVLDSAVFIYFLDFATGVLLRLKR